MRVFSTHRKKLEPKKRFGGREFRGKLKQASQYKRVFKSPYPGAWQKIWSSVGMGHKFWRWALLVVVLLFIYFFMISSKLVIADVQVSGNSQVSTQQIQDAISNYGGGRLFFIKKADYFLLSRGSLNKALTTQIPNIREISQFKKIWPNQLQITVTERTPGLVIKSDGNYFLVDTEGVIIKQIDAPGSLPVAEDSVVEDFGANDTLPNQKMTPFIMSMEKEWPTKLSSTIESISFPGKSADEVEFTTSEGWTVFFDTSRSATSELNNLSLILAQAVPAKNRLNLAYIDLRLAKWAYYCYKDSPCKQQPQPDQQPTTDINTTTNAQQ